MKRQVNELKDLKIDEISLVDRGANQHAIVTIAKRHGEEDKMDQYFDENGQLVDIDELSPGDVVYDADGDAFVYTFEDEVEEELEPVGKRDDNPFAQRSEPSRNYAEELRIELSKALTDKDRDAVISKAFGQMEEIAKAAERAQAAAESERQLRMEREYVEVAKGYSVGVDPEVLGPVLMRAAEALSYDDCVVIAKALDSVTGIADGYFEEIGKRGVGSNSDIYMQVEEIVNSQVSKGDFSREEMISAVFEDNPDAYDQYLAERRR